MSDLQQRLYKTKLTLLAVLLIVAGFGLMTFKKALPDDGLIGALPIGDIGSALLTTGVIGVILQYLDERDAEVRASDRLRRVLSEEAPAIRNAVIDGFAFSPETLKTVTSGDVLDRIARNSLALQLQSPEMAHDLHRDLIAAAMEPASRYNDSRLSVRLSRAPKAHPDMLRLTLHREYRYAGPPPTGMRFLCVTAADDYAAALRDPDTTEVWRLRPAAGLDASSLVAFALLDLALDGEAQAFRRQVRRGGQTFVASPSATTDGPHHLAFAYEVLVPRDRHSLYFDFGRPTLGLDFQLDVDDDAGIEIVQVLDFLGGPDLVRRSSRPDSPGGGTYSVGYDGWVLPPAGVVAVWRATPSIDHLAA